MLTLHASPYREHCRPDSRVSRQFVAKEVLVRYPQALVEEREGVVGDAMEVDVGPTQADVIVS